jgi:hypothetical protein
MKAILFALDRLSENSTWRGLILVAVGLGVKLEPEMQNQIIAAGLSLVGTINIFRKGK